MLLDITLNNSNITLRKANEFILRNYRKVSTFRVIQHHYLHNAGF